jgi:Raf kinase inhibitor-like YbhB/YbcL family protein
MESRESVMPIIAPTKYITALTFVAIVSSMFVSQGGVEEMKNLEVKLGFSQVPADYTCDGKDTSPKIEINGLNATSVALILDDPDAPSGTFTHWIIWNMEPTDNVPADIPNNPTLIKPIKAVQGSNSAGRIGYLGPCPPKGKPHRYYFRVYGLDRMLDLNPGATRKELENAMKGRIMQQGETMATYQR